MKVIGKRKHFKTNNSSEVLYGLQFLMPLLWEGENVMTTLGEGCTAIHVIRNCAEYNLV